MKPKDPIAAAARRGESTALEHIESGAACWMDFDTPQGHVQIHPELGIPIKAFPNRRLFPAGDFAELESLVRGYNAQIKAAHDAGKLRDFRPRVLTVEEFEQRFAKGGEIRLARNAEVTSPDGRYTIKSAPKSRCLTLTGPDGEEWQLDDELDADFIFLPDAETLLFRTSYSFRVVDLPTKIPFSYCSRRRDEPARIAEEAREADDRERRRCTTHWTGAGKRIDGEEFEELIALPKTLIENAHLERCTLLDSKIGAIPDYGGAAEWYAGRATVRNVTLVKCDMVRCHASSVVFENVTLDNTNMRASNVFDGCLFDRVTLRGHIGAFVAETAQWTRTLRSHQEVPDAIRELHAAFYENVEWALDLTGLKSGKVDIGDIPIELVRVNPELCFIMSRERAMKDDFEKVEGVEYTDITNMIWEFRRTTRASLLFVANPRAKSYKLDIEALRNMRRAGIVT